MPPKFRSGGKGGLAMAGNALKLALLMMKEHVQFEISLVHAGQWFRAKRAN